MVCRKLICRAYYRINIVMHKPSLRMASARVLVTRDTGIPSQAYAAQYAHNGLTIVLLRWKTSTMKDFQQMAEAILRDGEKWIHIAETTPSIISVNRHQSRPRAWAEVPDSITHSSGAAS